MADAVDPARLPDVNQMTRKGKPSPIEGNPEERYIPRRRELNALYALLYNAYVNNGDVDIPDDPQQGLGINVPSALPEGGPFYPKKYPPDSVAGNDRLIIGGPTEWHDESDADGEKSFITPGRDVDMPGMVVAGSIDAILFEEPVVVDLLNSDGTDWEPGTTPELRALVLDVFEGMTVGTSGEAVNYLCLTPAELENTGNGLDPDGGSLTVDHFYFVLGWILAAEVDRENDSGGTDTCIEIRDIVWPRGSTCLRQGSSSSGGGVPVRITEVHPDSPTGAGAVRLFRGDAYADGSEEAATDTDITIRIMGLAAGIDVFPEAPQLATPIRQTWTNAGGLPVSEQVYEVQDWLVWGSGS